VGVRPELRGQGPVLTHLYARDVCNC
jgi:hypothetical protein